MALGQTPQNDAGATDFSLQADGGQDLFEPVDGFDASTGFPAFPESDMEPVSWDMLPPWNESTPPLTGSRSSEDMDLDLLLSDLDGIGSPEAVRLAASKLPRPIVPRPNPTFSNDREETLVHTAARGNDVATLKLLAQAGCELNERDSRGRTPLHSAYEENHLDAILWLLEQGVDVNAVDKDGRTALSMAVNNKCHIGVRLMLSHGASPFPKQAEEARLSSVSKNVL